MWAFEKGCVSEGEAVGSGERPSAKEGKPELSPRWDRRSAGQPPRPERQQEAPRQREDTAGGAESLLPPVRADPEDSWEGRLPRAPGQQQTRSPRAESGGPLSRPNLGHLLITVPGGVLALPSPGRPWSRSSRSPRPSVQADQLSCLVTASSQPPGRRLEAGPQPIPSTAAASGLPEATSRHTASSTRFPGSSAPQDEATPIPTPTTLLP